MLKDVPTGFKDLVEWVMRLNTTMMQLYEAAVTGAEPEKIDPYTIGAKLTVIFELRDGLAIAAYPSATDQARIVRRVTLTLDSWWDEFGGTWPPGAAPPKPDFSVRHAVKNALRPAELGFPEPIPMDRAPWDYVVTCPGRNFSAHWTLLDAVGVADSFVYV
ncbi:hypothetical protein [Microbacterium sp. che218]|uniref:hypothetical protein n=1 Tax=Microbacterium sp. che218 TaxID=3140649 RepID=UPI003365B840